MLANNVIKLRDSRLAARKAHESLADKYRARHQFNIAKSQIKECMQLGKPIRVRAFLVKDPKVVKCLSYIGFTLGSPEEVARKEGRNPLSYVTLLPN